LAKPEKLKMKKRAYCKLWFIGLVLLSALATTGVSYAAWVSTINVNGVVLTAVIDADMAAGGAQPAGINSYAIPNATPVLVVQLINASGPGDYTAAFMVTNPLIPGIGKVPVKVQSISISAPSAALPSGSTITVSGIAAGNQIDPGQSWSGLVSVHLTGSVLASQFTVTVSVKQWNQ